MKLKKSVITEGVCPQIWWVLGVLDHVYEYNYGEEFVVTSLKDGAHSTHSKHYTGEAADIRTRNFTRGEVEELYGYLRRLIDPHGFDTVLESDHIHIEWDPKSDEHWFTRTS